VIIRIRMRDRIFLVIFCVVVVLYRFVFEEPSNFNLQVMGIMGVVLLLFSIASWMSRGFRFLSPYLIFLFVLYVFCYGQPLLMAFNLLSEDGSLIGYLGITRADLYNSDWLTLLMLAFFHLGALICVDKNKRKLAETRQINNIRVSNRLKWVGLVLFIISFYPYVRETVNDLVYSFIYGYGALYEREQVTGLDHATSFLSDLFIPSVICLFIGYRDNKKIRYFLSLLLFINIAAIFMIGGRSNGVILLAILIIIQDSLIRHFTKKDYIILSIGTVFLLILMSALATTRNEGGRSLDVDSFSSDDNMAVKAIAEMGGSQSCLVKTMELVPSATEDFRYGRTYFFAFTTIIPNLNFWDIHPAKKYANSSDWLTDKLGLSYGTGFSMTAEAYINFGYFGILVFLLFGYLFAKIFGSIDSAIKKHDMGRVVFLLIIFWFALKLPRNNFINIVRPFFYIVLPIYVYCNYSLAKYANNKDTKQSRLEGISES